jgi:hypothetical protein
MNQVLVQEQRIVNYYKWKLHGKITSKSPKGYLWDDPTSPENCDNGSPVLPWNFFTQPMPHDLVVDFHGDAKKLKLRLEGKVGSIHIQYANHEPEVNFKIGTFAHLKGQQEVEINKNNCYWNIVNSDWIFHVKENVDNLTIRIHDCVDSVLLSIPPGIGNLLIRIFDRVSSILLKRYSKYDNFSRHFKMSKMESFETVHSGISSKKPRRNFVSSIETISRVAYSVFAIIRLILT